MHRTANSSARELVQQREEFRGSSLFGCWDKELEQYAVYSYGSHWPLFIWEDGAWYENSGKYSLSTTKHRSQCHPHCETTLLTPAEMCRVNSVGAREYMLAKLKGEPAYA